MTRDRLNQELQQIKSEALFRIRAASPYKTGYQQSQIKARDLPNGGFEIFVSNVPYYEYTTDGWSGRQSENPNEGWDKEAIANVNIYIKTKLNALYKGVK